MTAPKTILPDEIKKWIVSEANKHVVNTAGDNGAKTDFMRGATSLYQHLSEQKDKEIRNLELALQKLLKEKFGGIGDINTFKGKVAQFEKENNLKHL